MTESLPEKAVCLRNYICPCGCQTENLPMLMNDTQIQRPNMICTAEIYSSIFVLYNHNAYRCQLLRISSLLIRPLAEIATT